MATAPTEEQSDALAEYLPDKFDDPEQHVSDLIDTEKPFPVLKNQLKEARRHAVDRLQTLVHANHRHFLVASKAMADVLNDVSILKAGVASTKQTIGALCAVSFAADSAMSGSSGGTLNDASIEFAAILNSQSATNDIRGSSSQKASASADGGTASLSERVAQKATFRALAAIKTATGANVAAGPRRASVTPGAALGARSKGAASGTTTTAAPLSSSSSTSAPRSATASSAVAALRKLSDDVSQALASRDYDKAVDRLSAAGGLAEALDFQPQRFALENRVARALVAEVLSMPPLAFDLHRPLIQCMLDLGRVAEASTAFLWSQSAWIAEEQMAVNKVGAGDWESCVSLTEVTIALLRHAIGEHRRRFLGAELAGLALWAHREMRNLAGNYIAPRIRSSYSTVVGSGTQVAGASGVDGGASAALANAADLPLFDATRLASLCAAQAASLADSGIGSSGHSIADALLPLLIDIAAAHTNRIEHEVKIGGERATAAQVSNAVRVLCLRPGYRRDAMSMTGALSDQALWDDLFRATPLKLHGRVYFASVGRYFERVLPSALEAALANKLTDGTTCLPDGYPESKVDVEIIAKRLQSIFDSLWPGDAGMRLIAHVLSYLPSSQASQRKSSGPAVSKSNADLVSEGLTEAELQAAEAVAKSPILVDVLDASIQQLCYTQLFDLRRARDDVYRTYLRFVSEDVVHKEKRAKSQTTTVSLADLMRTAPSGTTPAASPTAGAGAGQGTGTVSLADLLKKQAPPTAATGGSGAGDRTPQGQGTSRPVTPVPAPLSPPAEDPVALALDDDEVEDLAYEDTEFDPHSFFSPADVRVLGTAVAIVTLLDAVNWVFPAHFAGVTAHYVWKLRDKARSFVLANLVQPLITAPSPLCLLRGSRVEMETYDSDLDASERLRRFALTLYASHPRLPPSSPLNTLRTGAAALPKQLRFAYDINDVPTKKDNTPKLVGFAVLVMLKVRQALQHSAVYGGVAVGVVLARELVLTLTKQLFCNATFWGDYYDEYNRSGVAKDNVAAFLGCLLWGAEPLLRCAVLTPEVTQLPPEPQHDAAAPFRNMPVVATVETFLKASTAGLSLETAIRTAANQYGGIRFELDAGDDEDDADEPATPASPAEGHLKRDDERIVSLASIKRQLNEDLGTLSPSAAAPMRSTAASSDTPVASRAPTQSGDGTKSTTTSSLRAPPTTAAASKGATGAEGGHRSRPALGVAGKTQHHHVDAHAPLPSLGGKETPTAAPAAPTARQVSPPVDAGSKSPEQAAAQPPAPAPTAPTRRTPFGHTASAAAAPITGAAAGGDGDGAPRRPLRTPFGAKAAAVLAPRDTAPATAPAETARSASPAVATGATGAAAPRRTPFGAKTAAGGAAPARAPLGKR